MIRFSRGSLHFGAFSPDVLPASASSSPPTRRRSWSSAALLAAVLATGVAGLSAGPATSSTARADEPRPARQPDYLRDVKPLLKERCWACHGALQQQAGLRLDTASALLKGGDSGPAAVVGKPDESLVLNRVRAQDPAERMPPEGAPLTAAQQQLLADWIRAGFEPAADESPEPDPRDHWAFRPPLRATPPKRLDGRPVEHPVDAFLLAPLDAAGLAARPPADKPTLLRRAMLDLIGVPPTRAELQAFLADDSADAYETVIDRLLMDPRYGERWGRHWMDVWRYADWYGRRHVPDVWNSAPQIWRWRDWIVRSLNEDRGYDRMVREMLAADETAFDSPADGVATGYLIRNWYALNPNDWMRANVEHASKAFLGLTFHCAHCHDHKYDPIKQDDYFRLRAFFETIDIRQDRAPGEADPGPFQEYSYGVLRKIQRLGAVQVYDKNPAAPTWFYTGGDERNRAADRGSIPPGLPAFLGGAGVKVEPVALPPSSFYPALRAELAETLRGELRATVATAEQARATAGTEVAAALPPLQAQLAAAQAELAQAAAKPAPSGAENGPLAGRQSLLLTAGAGRRAIQNRLAALTVCDSGTTIEFQLRILQDAHVNFQLVKDFAQGLTASFVGFEKGRILAYQPGGFTEFQAGTYDFASGQRRFAVSLTLDRAADRCLLAVRSLADDKLLVDGVPVALNGWNPPQQMQQGVSFDARPGSVAAIDELRATGPAAPGAAPAVAVAIGFEPPAYVESRDVDGIEGWQVSPFSVAPSVSSVVTTLGDDPLAPLKQKVAAASRAIAAQELRIAAAERKIEAARAELASLDARLAADSAKHARPPLADLEARQKAASQAHREAARKKALADVTTHDQALAAAESKPASDANRAKELEAASKALAAARDALAKADAALADPAQATAYPSVGPVYPATSTGRRAALARWIASRDNPLAARVAVNHVWLRHFHSPLVATVFDFGRNGARPTHPELLDWLAVELMESGWSMKHLHRLLMTSEAYRRSSANGDAAAASVDPENRRLWRMNTGRLEAEAVRDSLLFTAGRLDPTMGGQELENSQALTTFRRTIYYSCQPEIDGKSEFGALFDAPEPADCYRRTRSVIPQQSLALTNSALVHELSGKLAADLAAELTAAPAAGAPPPAVDPARFVELAFEQVLTRRPSEAERRACLEFLQSAPDAANGRASLVRALFNHHDFITVR